MTLSNYPQTNLFIYFQILEKNILENLTNTKNTRKRTIKLRNCTRKSLNSQYYYLINHFNKSSEKHKPTRENVSICKVAFIKAT